MRNIIILLAIAAFFSGCDKVTESDCVELKSAVLTDNLAEVKRSVNGITSSLKAVTSADDPTGHRRNFSILIERLNSCDLSATEVCYACIQTLPATSEIRIEIERDSQTISRIIDIRPNRANRLECSNMHE
jgi:hypothetical protein